MISNYNKETVPIVGITMGDYNGIGPEVLIKALAHDQKLYKATFVIFGSSFVLNSVNQYLNRPISLITINSLSEIDKHSHNIFILDIFNNCEININYGTISQEAGNAAVRCLHHGIKFADKNSIQALVTAPVCKQALILAGFNYPGQTEMLAQLTNTTLFAMMFIADNFRVGLVTTHCAISEVSAKINKQNIFQKIKVLNHSLQNDFKIKKPKVAVTGLNPHGGEGGIFGDEEQRCILPAIIEAKNAGVDVSGPFSAETLFAKIKTSAYDAFLAMYHDQGLIPVKMRAFGKSVNFTAGLPIIRTSPDHGTAFDIAGKWIADESSMREAIKIGYQLAKKRTAS